MMDQFSDTEVPADLESFGFKMEDQSPVLTGGTTLHRSTAFASPEPKRSKLLKLSTEIRGVIYSYLVVEERNAITWPRTRLQLPENLNLPWNIRHKIYWYLPKCSPPFITYKTFRIPGAVSATCKFIHEEIIYFLRHHELNKTHLYLTYGATFYLYHHLSVGLQPLARYMSEAVRCKKLGEKATGSPAFQGSYEEWIIEKPIQTFLREERHSRYYTSWLIANMDNSNSPNPPRPLESYIAEAEGNLRAFLSTMINRMRRSETITLVLSPAAASRLTTPTPEGTRPLARFLKMMKLLNEDQRTNAVKWKFILTD